ncbi:MAG: carbamoyltransferase C-terminal domain-containing protein [Thermoplasmata archaeon]
MRVLGIHDGHNASAALLEEGKVRYVFQEERLTNLKNYVGFPERSIHRILELSRLSLDDLDEVAWASNYMLDPYDPRKIGELFVREYTIPGRKTWEGLVLAVRRRAPRIYDRLLERGRRKRAGYLREMGYPGAITFVDHHTSHAATAYYGCPWPDERVLVLTNDGAGDALCSTVNLGEGGTFHRIAETTQADSLGHLYSRVTMLLGMIPLDHEYKVMGLAPYAPEQGGRKSYAILRKYVGLDGQGLTFKRQVPEPLNFIYPRLKRDLDLHRFDWIAWGLQHLTEKLLVQWVRNCVRKTGLRKLAVAGGVFMNVKANQRILELPEVDGLFIFPSCGDDSISLGAAYWVYAQRRLESGLEVEAEPLGPIYWGDDFTEGEVREAMELEEFQGYDYFKATDADAEVADLVLKGEIVARCRGRMEFGARALGNRSILSDAADLTSIETINSIIKNRDFWMPFAPVILKEREHEYLINEKRQPAPYMILTFDTTDRREDIAAAIHAADRTARPQVIEEAWNPAYYGIVQAFEEETGRGGLLNTSFNVHGYPIVHGPEEALWTFATTGLQHLALGDFIFSKSD